MQGILAVVERFGQYSVVWNQERDVELKAFLGTDPRLSDFEEKFRFYDELEERFLSEPDCTIIGPIAIHTGDSCYIKCILVFKLSPFLLTAVLQCTVIISRPGQGRLILATQISGDPSGQTLHYRGVTLLYKKPSYCWEGQPRALNLWANRSLLFLEHRIPMPELFTELRFSILRQFWTQEIRLPLLGDDAPRLG